uniref:cytochrome c553 n=1 Tax=Synarthrophyton patena TaxID=48972 RepID=UPI00218235A5|nr:cytochrome c553 [Synarthrophyton patena]UVF62834.1 cytochrome c553 [Synarthrophyton patena]
MNKLLMSLLLILSILLINLEPEVYAADLQAGQQVFSDNCSACHLGGNNVIMPEKTLKKIALEENSMNSIGAITTQVKNGKNAMPAFGGRLEDDDIENVANYVLSQSEQGW